MIYVTDTPSFEAVRQDLRRAFRTAPRVATERWQGLDVSQNPAAVSYELRNVEFEVSLGGFEDLDHWRQDIQPNLPWADDHFLERVGGEPLNPGREWANWPWAGSAARFKETHFNHTYMERLWPKFARRSGGGTLPEKGRLRKYPAGDKRPKYGVAYYWGDLEDLVEMLAKEPHTRQGFIPLFFPEDTGVGDGGRKPCTLGYQVMVRDGEAHMWYPLRSCDFVRHWADDCYLAVRLLLWIIDRCREINGDDWLSIRPGSLAMHCTSLHIFENDRRELLKS
jgi:hypothetical protein